MSKKTIKVGYEHIDYGAKRNFLDIKIDNCYFCRIIGLFKLVNIFTNRILKFSSPFLQNLYFDIGINRNVNIIHLWNGLSTGKLPWIVTYETTLPRWNENSKLGLNLLNRSQCKKIIALSRCSQNMMENSISRHSKYVAIKNKLTVLHPPQSLITCNESTKPHLKDKIIFTIVGRDFFRKGGKEILKAFEYFINKNAPVKLNIISSLNYGDYASHTTKEDYFESLKIIERHPNNITHFTYLPNNKVIDIMDETHIGLLPTYADTYGYSVLEFQASGCPVISTNVRALPEINNNECGWMINVNKNKNNVAYYNTEKNRRDLSRTIISQLIEIMDFILANPDKIQYKAKLSIQRIKLFHDPIDHAKKLVDIYLDALDNNNN